MPVWRVATMWTAALAGVILGAQAFLAGEAPPAPQIAVTAAAAIVCGVSFALLVGVVTGTYSSVAAATLLGGWTFTIGFLHLAFWHAVLAIVLWPYYLGAHFSAVAR